MDVISKLEQEHRNYKLKKLIVTVIAPAFGFFIIGSISYGYFTLEEPALKEEKQVTKQKKKEIPSNKPISKKKIDNNFITITPDYTFENNLKTNSIEEKTIEPSLPKKISVSNNSSFTKRSVDPIQSLQSKFQQEPTFETAVKIADLFYKKEKFREAYNWSLKANEIDSSKEESWIIFAKSSIKLGRTEVAMKAIDAYLESNKSDKLYQIKEEIFR
ncbi:MAG: CDC27 family protein [Campylobacterales bacterium]|nr:CDC27 family protein [Campylobacterales bacterium]